MELNFYLYNYINKVYLKRIKYNKMFQARRKIKTTLLNIPGEIKENIFIYLSYDDIISLCLANKRLLNYFKDSIFWKNKIKNDFPLYTMIDKDIKAQYQLLLSNRLSKIYNGKYNIIIIDRQLRNKILRLTHQARIKIPIIPVYKYIELIMDNNEEDSIINSLTKLGYKKERAIIPLSSFEDFCKKFGFMKQEATLNYRNIIGFTYSYDNPPTIIGYVFSSNNRLYVNWSTSGYYDNLCDWPIELERDLCSNGNKLNEIYPTLKIGFSHCIDFKKNQRYNEEFL